MLQKQYNKNSVSGLIPWLKKTREFALYNKYINPNPVDVGPLRSSEEKEALVMILAEG